MSEPNEAKEAKTSKSLPAYIVGLGFYAIMAFFFIQASPELRQWILDNRLALGIVATVLVVGGIVLWLRKEIISGSTAKQIGVIIFVGIPTILFLFGILPFLENHLQVFVLRAIFVLIVSLLPATMYYLFIVSRKTSLLQEFFTNISKLGLLETQAKPQEYEAELSVRVMTYIQKFESVYGPIGEDLGGQIIEYARKPKEEREVPEFHNYNADKNTQVIFTPETTIPVIMATILIFMGWLITLPPWEYTASVLGERALEASSVQAEGVVAEVGQAAAEEDLSADAVWGAVFYPLQYTVNFAFLGAYFFIIQMIFRRYVLRDLRSNAFVSASIRIILAVIGTWAAIQVVRALVEGDIVSVEPPGLYVLGFVIGAFPPIAWQVIQAFLKKITFSGYFVPSLKTAQPVSDLDGLTIWHEARLEEEDVENVPNMATADLVELMLNTRFPPDRVIEWVDQAILLTHIGVPSQKTSVEDGDNGKGDNGKGAGDGAEGEGAQGATQQASEHRHDHESLKRALRQHGIYTASALTHRFSRADRSKDPLLTSECYGGRIESLLLAVETSPNLRLVQYWKGLIESPQPQATT